MSIVSKHIISLCPHCNCMTKTVKSLCGKCLTIKTYSLNSGCHNGMWKGNSVGFSGIHLWLRRRKNMPEFCESCETKPPTDWANISGLYKREVDDFEALCRSCHMKKDGRMKKLRTYNIKEKCKRNHPLPNTFPRSCKQCVAMHSRNWYRKKFGIKKDKFRVWPIVSQ